MDHPIERYLSDLRRHLTGSESERAALLEEVRGHLEEKAASYSAQGMDGQAAEQEAVKTFGSARHLVRQLAAVQPAHWGVKRFLLAMLLGAIVAWGLWTAIAFPLVTNISMIDLSQRVVSSPPSLLHLLILSTPLSTVSFGELWFHSGVLPVVLLYFIPAFLWGKSARRWWLPGLAYGLGAVITHPLPYFGLAFTFYAERFEYHTAAVMVLMLLPLTVAAAGLGALWQRAQSRMIIKVHPLLAGQALPAFPGQPSTAVLLFRRPVSLRWLALIIIVLAILALEAFFYWRLWTVG
jgi:hypothetical protein